VDTQQPTRLKAASHARDAHPPCALGHGGALCEPDCCGELHRLHMVAVPHMQRDQENPCCTSSCTFIRWNSIHYSVHGCTAALAHLAVERNLVVANPQDAVGLLLEDLPRLAILAAESYCGCCLVVGKQEPVLDQPSFAGALLRCSAAPSSGLDTGRAQIKCIKAAWLARACGVVAAARTCSRHTPQMRCRPDLAVVPGVYRMICSSSTCLLRTRNEGSHSRTAGRGTRLRSTSRKPWARMQHPGRSARPQ
jgi:hypothetical protein